MRYITTTHVQEPKPVQYTNIEIGGKLFKIKRIVRTDEIEVDNLVYWVLDLEAV